jgi:hypothetical protein
VSTTWDQEPAATPRQADIDRLREAWEPLAQALRRFAEACLAATSKFLRALSRWLRPDMHGRHVRPSRIQRRAQRRRLARMLRQQRRAR